MEIRPFEPADAHEAADVLNEVEPEFVTTPELLLHQVRAPLTATQRAHWVAVDTDQIVGVCNAYLRAWSSDLDVGQIHLGVRADHRRRGIGTELLEAAERHLVSNGGRRLRVRAARESDGAEFAHARGYARRVVSEVLWALDPRAADLSELPELERLARSDGLKLSPLRDHRDSAQALFDFYGAAGGIPPGAPVTFEEWRAAILGNPTLDFNGSFVITGGSGPVALAWLLLDHDRRKAENEWTATLPELRGRGLARLAKLASIEWAAATGIREIRTENDIDNAPMLALNRRLGYREIAIRDDLEKGNG
jgi:RimJ/RimL family protein N-acetyltransferase